MLFEGISAHLPTKVAAGAEGSGTARPAAAGLPQPSALQQPPL